MNIRICQIQNISEYKPAPYGQVLFVTSSRPVADFLSSKNEAVAIELSNENELSLWNGYKYFTINQGSNSGHLQKIFCHIKNIPFVIGEDDTICVREEKPDDLEDIYRLYEDSECKKYLEPLPGIDSVDKIARFESVKSGYMLFEYGMWIIEDKASGKVIGRVGFEYRDENSVYIGFAVIPSQRKKGIARKACLLAINYLHEVLPDINVFAKVNPTNEASINLLTSLCIPVESL